MSKFIRTLVLIEPDYFMFVVEFYVSIENQNKCRPFTFWPQNINSIDFGIDKTIPNTAIYFK